MSLLQVLKLRQSMDIPPLRGLDVREPVIVAVLDSGIRDDHPAFRVCILPQILAV